MSRSLRITLVSIVAMAALPWTLKWTYVCYLLARDTLT